MKKLNLKLNLFDAGAAGAAAGAAGAAATGTAAGQKGATNASNGVSTQTQQAEQVIYGKQHIEGQQDNGDSANPGQQQQQQQQETLKSIMTNNPGVKAEIEAIVERRIKNSKAELDSMSRQMQALDPILTTLYARYGVQDGDTQALANALQKDTSYLEEEAEMRGLSVEQLAYVKKLEYQNMINQRQQLQTQEQMLRQSLQARWTNESIEVKALYPDFDFETEINTNETFEKLIRANFPVRDAYEFAHREQLEQEQQAKIAAETQKQIAQNMRARQERPTEAGLKGQPGITFKSDPSKYTEKDIREIERRVRNGEKVYL